MPRARIELALLAKWDFESHVSTNSTTEASINIIEKNEKKQVNIVIFFFFCIVKEYFYSHICIFVATAEKNTLNGRDNVVFVKSGILSKKSEMYPKHEKHPLRKKISFHYRTSNIPIMKKFPQPLPNSTHYSLEVLLLEARFYFLENQESENPHSLSNLPI